MSDLDEKTCSAVGLRRRFWLQTNRTFFKTKVLGNTGFKLKLTPAAMAAPARNRYTRPPERPPMLDNARDYYGRVLGGSADLKTDACRTTAAPPPDVKAALANVHADVRARYYGCGLVVPDVLEGLSVLDLGSGSGQDAYVLAQLVGERGRVVGVDATSEQLAIARAHEAWHAARFGYAAPNTRFIEGDIERLSALGLGEAAFDLIVSNCVINLVADKAAVFAAAHRLLRPGGEMYFADVYADRRVPAELLADPVLHGECLAGALYWGDFVELARAAGFGDPRLVEDRPLALGEAVAGKLDGIGFYSATWRLFRVDGLEATAEDYGQTACYRGTIPGAPDRFALDKAHRFDTGRAVAVSGNTAEMLAGSRFAPHFEFTGDRASHRGAFGRAMPFDAGQAARSSCC